MNFMTNTGKGKQHRPLRLEKVLQVAESRPGEVKTLPWRVTEADRGSFCAEGK